MLLSQGQATPSHGPSEKKYHRGEGIRKLFGPSDNNSNSKISENDPDYKANRKGRKIRPVVQKLLDKTGLDLFGGGGISELIKFQEHFREYKITVYQGLACEDNV